MASVIKRVGTFKTIQEQSGLIDNDPEKVWKKLLLCLDYYDEKNIRFARRSSVILQCKEEDLKQYLGNYQLSALLQKTWVVSSIQEYNNRDGKQVKKPYETLLSVFEAEK